MRLFLFKATSVAAVLLAAVLPIGGRAQSFDLDAQRLAITRIDSAWRFNLGDDAHWAQPEFDDAHWKTLQPGTNWTTQGFPVNTELAWFRFKLRAPADTQSLMMELPAISKSYQLFCDGKLIAQVGGLPPGRAHNVIGAARVFTLPVNAGASPRAITIALRVWQDPSVAGARRSVLDGAAYAGSADVVLEHFAATKAMTLLASGSVYTMDILVLIVGGAAAMLFWLTRERFYLWFCFYLVLDALFYVGDLASEHQAWDFYFFTYLSILTDLVSSLAMILFIVDAISLGTWKRMIVPTALAIVSEAAVILVLRGDIKLVWGDIGYCVAGTAVHIVLAGYLIKGWRGGNLYAKLLFFPFAINAAVLLTANFELVLLDLNILRSGEALPHNVILLHEPFPVNLDQFGRVVSLLGLLAVLIYRFARTSREQQRLSAALKAARDIQQGLVPIDVPAFGGLRTEIAYQAAEEVGGDFCQVIGRPDGSIFIVIGDVSGKGLKAAMLGTVAVGALRSMAYETVGPAIALQRLNNVVLRSEGTGFITCLCMVLSADGEVLMANAGHLAPYLDGVEVALEPELPLGIIAGTRYRESAFVLPATARLTLLSDGVVEARSRSGELFGFERTSEASRLPASEIAEQACRFGQEDDITVITLDWSGAAVAAA